MAIFLFRNADNPVEYCATDTRSGHRLPALQAQRAGSITPNCRTRCTPPYSA